jgi:hypothetical protein
VYDDLSSFTLMFDIFDYFTVLSLIFMDVHFRDTSAKGRAHFISNKFKKSVFYSCYQEI